MIRPVRTSRVILPPLSWSMILQGERYRQLISTQLAPWWSKIFGQHLLKLGTLSADLDTSAAQLPHQVALAPEAPHLNVVAEVDCLPFLQKTFDAALLAFTLDYASDPHALLREVDRVLIDDGYLIMIDCNPLSLLGIGHCLPRLRQRFPYQCRMFAPFRITDWLYLLNYEVIHIEAFMPFPWRTGTGGFSNFCNGHLPALSGLRLIVARKRTIPLMLNGSTRNIAPSRVIYPVGACQNITSPADTEYHQG